MKKIPKLSPSDAKLSSKDDEINFCERTINIIKRNSFQTSWWFLLSELPSFFCSQKNVKSHEKVCENKDFCNVIIPSEDTKILGFNQYQKSDKVQFIIYADLECIIEKIDGCKNNPENSSSTNASEHIPSGFSMPAISSYLHLEVWKISVMYAEVNTE